MRPDSRSIDHSNAEDLLTLQAFLALESELLDTRQWDQWLALFTSDAHYWVPTSATQTDPVGEPSLAYEDRLLMQIRIDRLRHQHAHSQQPPSQCQHVLQWPRIVEQSGSTGERTIVTHAGFVYSEQRGTQQSRVTGSVRHTLVDAGNGWQIRLKRIDLLGADTPLPMLQLFL